MVDVLKGVGGGWTFLVSWVFPSVLAWSAFALLAFPHLNAFPVLKEVASTDASNQALVLLGASVLTAVLLSSLSTTLYRVLEGYVFMPERFAARARWRQLVARRRLDAELERLLALRISVQSGEDVAADQIGLYVRIALVREELRRFPADPRQVGPTRLANALRAIETYGWDRYRLDSQTFWSELQAVIPEGMRGEEAQARAPMNCFVSLVYLSLMEACVFCFIGVTVSSDGRVALLTVGGLALLLVPVWYRLAVASSRYLLAVIQATVNLGRAPLAAAMGLSLPGSLEAERDMWERTYWLVHAQFRPEYASDLDIYRADTAVRPRRHVL